MCVQIRRAYTQRTKLRGRTRGRGRDSERYAINIGQKTEKGEIQNERKNKQREGNEVGESRQNCIFQICIFIFFQKIDNPSFNWGTEGKENKLSQAKL